MILIRTRIDVLLDHMCSHPDRVWTTADVHAFHGRRAPKMTTAREDLKTLHNIGWLELHDDQDGRYYTLARKDTHS